MHKLRHFAWLNLGVVQSLASGVVSATDAIHVIYNVENCLYVRKHLQSKEAQEIMSRGVQLPDIFAALSVEEASREFLHELEQMRALCMKLLDKKRAAGNPKRAAA